MWLVIVELGCNLDNEMKFSFPKSGETVDGSTNWYLGEKNMSFRVILETEWHQTFIQYMACGDREH